MGWMGVPGVRKGFRDREEGLSVRDTVEGWAWSGHRDAARGQELKEGEGEQRSERGPGIGRHSAEGVGDGAGLRGERFGTSGWVGGF